MREEVLLLREEMRRTLAYLDWSSQTWEKRKKLRPTANTAHHEGLVSYAHKQANLQRALSTQFKKLWKTPLEDVDRNPIFHTASTASNEIGGTSDDINSEANMYRQPMPPATVDDDIDDEDADDFDSDAAEDGEGSENEQHDASAGIRCRLF